MYQGVSASSCGNRNSSIGLTNNNSSKNQSRGNSANMKNLNMSNNKASVIQ